MLVIQDVKCNEPNPPPAFSLPRKVEILRKSPFNCKGCFLAVEIQIRYCLKNWFFVCDCGFKGKGCLVAGYLFVTFGEGTYGFVHKDHKFPLSRIRFSVGNFPHVAVT